MKIAMLVTSIKVGSDRFPGLEEHPVRTEIELSPTNNRQSGFCMLYFDGDLSAKFKLGEAWKLETA